MFSFKIRLGIYLDSLFGFKKFACEEEEKNEMMKVDWIQSSKISFNMISFASLTKEYNFHLNLSSIVKVNCFKNLDCILRILFLALDYLSFCSK